MKTRRLRWTPRDMRLHVRNGLYLDGQFQHRRRSAWKDVAWDGVLTVGLPLLGLASVVVLIWILVGVGRAVRPLGGL